MAFDKIINDYKFEMRKVSDPNFDPTPAEVWDYLVATIHNGSAAFNTFLTSVDEEIRLHHKKKFPINIPAGQIGGPTFEGTTFLEDLDETAPLTTTQPYARPAHFPQPCGTALCVRGRQ